MLQAIMMGHGIPEKEGGFQVTEFKIINNRIINNISRDQLVANIKCFSDTGNVFANI